MDWFRSHHGAPTDPKWLSIARRAKVRPGDVAAIVWALLDHASRNESERGSIAGYDAEALADFYGYETEEVEAVVSAMRDKGVLNGDRFAAWEKRQPKREDSGATERKRSQRERDKNKSASGDDPSRDVTHGHAASRDVTTDKRRVEENREVPSTPPACNVVPAPAPEGASAVVAKFLELREAGWPSDSRLPAPTMTLRHQAQQHLDAGGSVDLVCEVLERGFQTWKHPTPPKSLEAFRDSLTDRIAEFKRAGEAPPPRAGKRFDQPGPVAAVIVSDKWSRDRVRLQAFKRSGVWDFGDPPPGHPRCQIPRNVLEEELGSEWLEHHSAEVAA